MWISLLLACAQGAPDIASRFEVPAKLTVTVWASTPHVAAPSAIDVDWRGRVWVAERNGKISILEDSDGDGACDAAQVFRVAVEGAAVHDFAVIGERALLASNGAITAFGDSDGDGVADQESTWARPARPSAGRSAVRMACGPDGAMWLVGEGGDAPASVDIHAGNLADYRTFATGFASPCALAIDSLGNCAVAERKNAAQPARIVLANEGSAHGGATTSAFTLASGDASALAWYEGNVIVDLDGSLLVADGAGGAVLALRPEWSGATVKWSATTLLAPKASGERDVVAETLRPVDIAIGLDGSIFVADGGSAESSGRILRLAPAGRRMANPRLSLAVLNGQLGCLLSPATDVRATAIESLELGDEETYAKLKGIAQSSNPRWQARALWLLANAGDPGQAFAREFLSDGDARVRITAIRALRAVGHDAADLAVRCVGDPEPAVRAEALRTLGPAPAEAKVELIVSLCLPWPQNDPAFIDAAVLGARGAEAKVIAAFESHAEQPESEVTNEMLAELAHRLALPRAEGK